MENFLIIDDNTIKLNSGLNEYMFGKTSYSSVVSQAGVLYDGKTFTNWNFSDVQSMEVPDKDEPQVFYCGNNPLSSSATTLLSYFESGNRSKMFQAALCVCHALTQAATTATSLPMTGAGGILVDLSRTKPAILFLPENLYKYSTASLTEQEQANARGCWLNETLHDLPSICFTRAVIAYTMLTGEFPFPAVDIIERNADILDKKFLPIDLRLPNLPEDLTTQINNALKLTNSAFTQPGKKQKGKSNEALTPTATFPLDLLAAEEKNPPSLDEQKEISQKAQNYLKKRNSQINTKRALRHNVSTILGIAALFFIVLFIGLESRKSHLLEYTTQGLTSTQSILAFLQNVNAKDATMLGNFTRGKQPSKYVDTVSQVYVLSKQRQAYGKDNGFATPENYFFYVTDAYKNQSSGLYGITNVFVDGIPYELDMDIPIFKDERPSLKTEDGYELVKNVQAVHQVEYFLLHSEGEGNDILVEAVTEEYTLTYKSGRWFITHIDTFTEDIDLNSTQFKSEYFNYLKMNQNDVIRSVEMLSAKYPWVPTTASLEREKQRLIDIANDPFLGTLSGL